MMQITAQALAELLNGTVEGNPDVLVNRPSKIEDGGEGTISFLANLKYEPYAYTTTASILLVSEDFQPAKPINATLVRVKDVYASITLLINQFGAAQNAGQTKGEIAQEAFIHEGSKLGNEVSLGKFSIVEKGAIIGDNAFIYPQVFIGENAQIGKNVILYPGVKIHKDCVIGDNCILHSNVVIGTDGFGFAPQEDGTYQKIAQLGNVIIEDNVEIGANTTIDRATMGSTIIKEGTKLDNLIMVAHNVEIGKNTVMAAQTGIAGSTTVGDSCMIGGQVGLVGHINIPDRTKIQAQSGVTKSIRKTDQAIYGSPAIDYSNYLRSFAAFKNLPDLVKKVRELEKELKDLKKLLN